MHDFTQMAINVIQVHVLTTSLHLVNPVLQPTGNLVFVYHIPYLF